MRFAGKRQPKLDKYLSGIPQVAINCLNRPPPLAAYFMLSLISLGEANAPLNVLQMMIEYPIKSLPTEPDLENPV